MSNIVCATVNHADDPSNHDSPQDRFKLQYPHSRSSSVRGPKSSSGTPALYLLISISSLFHHQYLGPSSAGTSTKINAHARPHDRPKTEAEILSASTLCAIPFCPLLSELICGDKITGDFLHFLRNPPSRQCVYPTHRGPCNQIPHFTPMARPIRVVRHTGAPILCSSFMFPLAPLIDRHIAESKATVRFCAVILYVL